MDERIREGQGPMREQNSAAEAGAQPSMEASGQCIMPQKVAKEQKNPQWMEDLYVLLHDVVYFLAFICVFFVFCIRLVTVDGTSMFPTLEHQDRIALLSSVLYHDYKPGDIVVATKVEFDDEPIVKRVIATEGQTVDIDFDLGVVYVDGVALEEDYINAPTLRSFGADGVQFPLTVEPGHVFLMGDNRNNSYDSRYYLIGQVDTRCIAGKVICILWPGASGEYGTERDFGRIGAP